MPLSLVLIEDHQALREGLEASARVHALAITLREGLIRPPASDGSSA